MKEVDPYRVADGGVLRTLDSGLQIVRRKKHEWFPGLASMSRAELSVKTNKDWGSKFLLPWNLPRIVSTIESAVHEAGSSLESKVPNPLFVEMAEDVGLSFAKGVRRIAIVGEGRYIHAYPVE